MVNESSPTLGSNLSNLEAWLTARRVAGILGVLVVLRYVGVLLLGQTFIFRDFGVFGYPLATFQKECFWQGALPFWNPYNNLGIPFLAQWNTLCLYPPSLIYLLGPMPWSVNFYCAAHVWFGGLGMFLLARRVTGSSLAGVFAALAYSMGGMTQACLYWVQYTASVSWMPWVLLAMERLWSNSSRKDLAWAALIGTMQMLAGPPEVILFTWFAVVVMGVGRVLAKDMAWKPTLLRTSIVVGLVSLLASPQILPFFELLGQGDRDAGYSQGEWGMPLSGLGHLLVPLFGLIETEQGVFHQYQQGILSSYYCGILVVAFALMAVCRRNVRAWVAMAAIVFCLLLALSHDGPLYPLLHSVFPQIAIMRYPVKFVFMMTILLPVVGAMGVKDALDLLRAGQVSVLKQRLIAIGAVLGLLILGLVTVAQSKAYEGDAIRTLMNGLVRLLLLGGGIAAVLRIPREVEEPRRMRILVAALPILVTLDLVTHVPNQNPTARASILTTPTPTLAELNPRPGPATGRAMMDIHALEQLVHMDPVPANHHLRLRAALYDNSNILDGIPTVNGHYAIYLAREKDVNEALYGMDPFPTALADAMAVQQITSRDDIFKFTARPTALPLVSGGQRPVPVPDKYVLSTMLSPGFDPRQMVLVEQGDEAAFAGVREGNVEVGAATYKPNQLAFQVEAEQPSLVYVAVAKYPAWRATINGKAASIYPANHACLALIVPAGTSEVVLKYRDSKFAIGCGLTLVGLLLCGGLVFMERRNSPAAPEMEA